jgi:hypothetical protein
MQLIIAELRKAADGGMSAEIAKNLAPVARPFAPVVRAAILNIPVKGLVPYRQPPGLRLRIARCVTTFASWQGDRVVAGIEMDPRKMPSGQYSLPLGMQGVKRWRHPLFGMEEHWVMQGNAPHPYFYQNVAGMGPASRKAIGRALDQMTRAISGE